MQDRLQVNIFREGRLIVAVVSDGAETFRYQFNGNKSMKYVNDKISVLYMDEMFTRRIQQRARAQQLKRAV